MPNLAQMTVNAFWREITKLEQAAKTEAAALATQKLRLQHAYTQARNNSDMRRGAEQRRALEPIIHRNSVLRLRYRDLAGKFNSLMNGARNLLDKAGLTAPVPLSGMGVVPVVAVVSAATVAGLAIAWGIVHEIARGRNDVDRAYAKAVEVFFDPNSKEDEKQAAQKVIDAATKPGGSARGGDPLGLGNLVPLVGIAAVVILGPQLLKTFGGRRSAAA